VIKNKIYINAEYRIEYVYNNIYGQNYKKNTLRSISNADV
jgi:hypothetical protein